MPKDDLIRFLRDADDIVHLVTGKHSLGLLKRGVDLFSEGTGARVIGKRPKAEPGSPYATLDVRPDAHDIVVKAKYRALASQYRDNSEKFKELNEAYEQIAKLREW